MASLNLVHQDIKPANLLLKGETLWVADFGETTSNTGFAARGIDGVLLPENKRMAGPPFIKAFRADFEPLVPATDIWAAGFTLLTMLNPKKMLDPKLTFLNKFQSYPFGQLPYSQLSSTQQQQLRAKIHRRLDKFLQKTLKGDDARFIPALAEFFYQIFEPDCHQRLSAHDANRALKMYQKTIPASLII